MHYVRLSSTLTALYYLSACANISEGFVDSTHQTFSKVSSPAKSPSTSQLKASSLFKASTRIPTTTTRSTMLSYTSSTTTHAAASTHATATFVNPRSHIKTANASAKRRGMVAMDPFSDIPPGGAVRNSQPAQTSLFASASGETPDCPFTRFMAVFGSLWGSFGVVYILAKAIFRVLPIALEPMYGESTLVLSRLQWSLYGLSCLFFAYAEGYKGFHKKFAPLVVKRSFTLVIGTKQGNNPLNYFLAPLFSMGLWGATSKRKTISWGVSLGVAAIVAMVKRLPAAPRCILDAGVVVGLTIGSGSILYHFLSSLWTGSLPDVDACLPRAVVAGNEKYQ